MGPLELPRSSPENPQIGKKFGRGWSSNFVGSKRSLRVLKKRPKHAQKVPKGCQKAPKRCEIAALRFNFRQRVVLEFRGFQKVLEGVQKAPKACPKGAQRVPKSTQEVRNCCLAIQFWKVWTPPCLAPKSNFGPIKQKEEQQQLQQQHQSQQQQGGSAACGRRPFKYIYIYIYSTSASYTHKLVTAA